MDINDIEFDMNFDMDEMKECSNIFLSAHGMGSSKSSAVQRKFGEVLKKQGVGVISFNLPKTNGQLALVEECLQQFDVLEDWVRLNFDNAEVSLFGSSFGGYLMLQYFAKNPDKYKILILRAPAINMVELIIDGVKKEGVDFETWLAGSCSKEAYQDFSPKLFRNYSKHITLETGKSSKISIIASENDNVVDTKNYQKLAEGGANIFVIEGAAHNLRSPEDLEKFGYYAVRALKEDKVNTIQF